jgi:hypothetical protein
LSDDFSEKSDCWFDEIPPCKFCAGGDLGRGFPFRHRPAVRRQRRVADHGLEEGDLREVSAYSTVCPESAREAAYSQRPTALISMPAIPRHSIWHHRKMKSDRPPRFRKACNLPVPPRLPTASCPSTRVSISVGNAPNPKSFSRPPRTSTRPYRSLASLQRLPGSSVANVSLLFDDNEALRPRQRNFDTEPPRSCCHESQPNHRLETPLTRTPPPICTFAPGTQTALIWRTVGRRERVKRYTMRNF